MSITQANEVTPHFDWAAFFEAQRVEPGRGFSLSQPEFFAGMDSLLVHAPIGAWRAYLAFHTIARAAPYLSSAFEAENFAFNGTTLQGQPQDRPRWKRMLGTVNGAMGQALGQLYVARYFPPEAKQRAEVLVTNVRNALEARIEHLSWMMSIEGLGIDDRLTICNMAIEAGGKSGIIAPDDTTKAYVEGRFRRVGHCGND